MQKELYYQKDKIKSFSLLKLLITVMGTLIAGILSAAISGVYRGFEIAVPEWTPDIKINLAAWAINAVLMGVSLYLALQHRSYSSGAKRCKIIYLSLWALQTAFAFCWPIALFLFKLPTFAFIWLALLDGLVAALIVTAFKLRASSALILLPYFASLVFTTWFNISVLLLN